MRPAGIAFAANVSLPIRDSRLRFVHFVCLENCCNPARKLVSLSCGKLMVCCNLSISTPRNVIVVVVHWQLAAYGEQECIVANGAGRRLCPLFGIQGSASRGFIM